MRRMLSLVGGLMLGAMLSQFPEYAQQYTQRLGGAVDELASITAEFDSAAASAGLTREAALARYDATGDNFVGTRADSMRTTFARQAELTALLEHVRTDDALQRLLSFPQYFDSQIGRRTLQAYKPALPVTFEGSAYAAIGLMGGYLLVSGLYRFVTLPFRLRRRRVLDPKGT